MKSYSLKQLDTIAKIYAKFIRVKRPYVRVGCYLPLSINLMANCEAHIHTENHEIERGRICITPTILHFPKIKQLSIIIHEVCHLRLRKYKHRSHPVRYKRFAGLFGNRVITGS